jgi:3-methyladenine DNA glycosylase AlkC
VAAFKDELGAAAGRRLAGELAAAWPAFPVRRFTRGLAEALEPLELLARAGELARRLGETLPAAFPEAAAVLESALASATFEGWIVLPCGTYVARAGLDHLDVALPLLAALTPRASSEFAIRPFLERHPDRTYEYLHEWLAHPDEHVRRLVSEGTRPRLPWAPLLRALVADPAPNLPLLDALVTDPSLYVRRSVANHLNDISKDHPDLAVEIASGWAGRGPEAAWVVRHAMRTLVKRDDVRALRLVGAAPDATVEVRDLTVEPARVRIGEAVTFGFTLRAAGDAAEPVDVVVDYRVHYVGARGAPKPPKVFKLSRRRLGPGEDVTIRRRHAFAHVSIRRIHPGRHRIDLKVNGRVLATTGVDVVDAEA